MKVSIHGLDRNGKIIVHLEHSSELLSCVRHDGCSLLLGRQIPFRIQNHASDLAGAFVRSVNRKITANKTAFPIDHVAFCASRFAKKKSFSALRVSGKLDV